MADEVTSTQTPSPDVGELEFAVWMQRYLDASLEPLEITQLNARLRGDARWRSKFVRCLTQSTYLEEQLAQDHAGDSLTPDQRNHAWVLERLRQIAQHKRPLLKRMPASRPRIDLHHREPHSPLASIIRFPGAVYVLGGLAAAVLLVAILWSQRTPAPVGRAPADFVAMWMDGTDCKWADGDVEQAEPLPVKREMKLAEGVAEVQFGYGARAVIEAPARVEMADADRMILWEGSAVFHVPESAVGFIVDTPSIRVVDLGTEFGVRTTAAGKAEVYVFEGKVRVEPPTGRAADVELTAGKAAVVTPTSRGFVFRGNVKLDPARFKRQIDVKTETVPLPAD